jgi:hypothetical protein
VEVEAQESFQERLYVKRAIYLLDRRKAMKQPKKQKEYNYIMAEQVAAALLE